MAETKYMVILANSIRNEKRCVAGKELIRNPGRGWRIGPWIRLAHPGDPEGAVPFESTVCPEHGPVRPLDVVQLGVRSPCNNPDHPEDWWLDGDVGWQFVERFSHYALSMLADKPHRLWHDRFPDAVSAGYIPRMGKHASSICLIKAPVSWEFAFWKEPAPVYNCPGQMKEKKHLRLTFQHAGICHDCSVTDPEFTRRHDIFNRIQPEKQTLAIARAADAFFCLSLTLTFNSKHYKICATVFEP